MRSIVPVEAGGDGNITSEEDESAAAGEKQQLHEHLFCYCWWRSIPEFDERGRPDARLYPTTVAEATALTPRLRVIKEMERLALVAHDSLDDLRHKLLSYRAGDLWVPAGGIPKQDVDIPPVVTILLVGPAGSGKSSLVNLMYSVLGRSGLIPFARTSSGNIFQTSPHPHLLTSEFFSVLRGWG
uniref:Lon protease 2, peroxisomal n=1 Tax=Anthurium amnicola TaxID=1678845 RepID=A0A1D1Y899_9ARAE